MVNRTYDAVAAVLLISAMAGILYSIALIMDWVSRVH